VFAAGLVIASYFAAEYVRVRRPRRRGEAAALRPAAPPLEAVTAD
jgi:high-affinity iron transporter